MSQSPDRPTRGVSHVHTSLRRVAPSRLSLGGPRGAVRVASTSALNPQDTSVVRFWLGERLSFGSGSLGSIALLDPQDPPMVRIALRARALPLEALPPSRRRGVRGAVARASTLVIRGPSLTRATLPHRRHLSLGPLRARPLETEGLRLARAPVASR